MEHIDDYKTILNFLYFHPDYYFCTKYYIYIKACDICNKSIVNVPMHKTEVITITKVLVNSYDDIAFCLTCNENIGIIDRIYNISKYYSLLLLLSRELLTNNVPQGHSIPEISSIILNNIIKLNISLSTLNKYISCIKLIK